MKTQKETHTHTKTEMHTHGNTETQKETHKNNHTEMRAHKVKNNNTNTLKVNVKGLQGNEGLTRFLKRQEFPESSLSTQTSPVEADDVPNLPRHDPAPN